MERLSKVIDRLGGGGGGTTGNNGGVFPKLNHIAPTDARWVSCDRSLRCRSIGEVLLLLKSSSKIGDLLAGATPAALPGLSTLLHSGTRKEKNTSSCPDNDDDHDDGATTGNDSSCLKTTLTPFKSSTINKNENDDDEEEGEEEESNEEGRGGEKEKGRGNSEKEQAQHQDAPAASMITSREYAEKKKIVHSNTIAKYQLILKKYCNLEIPSIKSVIDKFFTEVILPEMAMMTDFVTDVYVDKKMRVWVIDMHPFGTSDPLLFSYDEPPLMSARRVDERKSNEKDEVVDDDQEKERKEDVCSSSISRPLKTTSKHTRQHNNNFEMRIIRSEEESRPSFFTYDRLPQEKVMMNLTSTEAIEQMVDAIREGKLEDTT
eukprot:jgi/Bigna1/147195/aug1.132_g21903